MVALLMVLCGAALAVAGAWMIDPAAGVTAAGLLLLAAGFDLAGDR